MKISTEHGAVGENGMAGAPGAVRWRLAVMGNGVELAVNRSGGIDNMDPVMVLSWEGALAMAEALVDAAKAAAGVPGVNDGGW